MRFVFASVMVSGLLIASSASANAAPRHHAPARAHAMVVDPNQGEVTTRGPSGTARFAVPGWSDESTREWIDKASSLVGVGG